MMDHQAIAELLGNYGEFIGSIAVVTTLIYLAYQLRQNTRSLNRTEVRESYQQYDRWREMILSREFSDLWLHGLQGKLTQQSEKFEFNTLFAQYTYAMQNTWECVESGIMDEDEWKRNAPYFASLFRMPGGADFWANSKTYYRPGFVIEIEKAQVSGDSQFV